MDFMALITATVLCSRSQDSVLSVSVGYMSYYRLLDLRAKESRVLPHVKPMRCGEACFLMVCMALTTAELLCARPRDSFVSVSTWGT